MPYCWIFIPGIAGSTNLGKGYAADRVAAGDLLVEFDADRSLLDLIGLELDLRELLGSHVDVATVASLKDRIRPRVLAEAVPL